jgi:transcriptional regulator with XRE-family HTH domain
MEPKDVVGANIRARRDELGVTPEEAARRAGIHPVEFARAERGTRDLRVSTVVKIARGLGMTASQLLEGAEDT